MEGESQSILDEILDDEDDLNLDMSFEQEVYNHNPTHLPRAVREV